MMAFPHSRGSSPWLVLFTLLFLPCVLAAQTMSALASGRYFLVVEALDGSSSGTAPLSVIR